MHTEQDLPEAAARAKKARPPRRELRWSVMGLALFLSVGLAVSAARAQQDEQKCSDDTRDNRPCTATEEAWYCVENAMDAYDECKDENGWWGDKLCYALYALDFYACGIDSVLDPFKKVMN